MPLNVILPISFPTMLTLDLHSGITRSRSTFRQDAAIEVHKDVGDFSDDGDLMPFKIAFYQDVIG